MFLWEILTKARLNSTNTHGVHPMLEPRIMCVHDHEINTPIIYDLFPLENDIPYKHVARKSPLLHTQAKMRFCDLVAAIVNITFCTHNKRVFMKT